MVKRIFLFLAVNFLVVLTISIILNVLGIRPYLDANGIDYGALLAFCFVWGMGGALISLALSKTMAKWMMGVQVIDPNTNDPTLRRLVNMVENLARAAGIPTPEVGIYRSPEVNAFATGPTKRNSIVAVSTGLLERMDSNQVEGVLSHEVSHIANGDMVTMTLLTGVVNAFVMFLARVIAFAAAQAVRGRDENEGMSYGIYFLVQIVFEIIFMILGSMVIAWFSRYREFRADAGGARLAGRERMISALEALRRTVEIQDPRTQNSMAMLKISNPAGIARLFASHPPLEERIARLRSMTA
ncbi:MAG TPA: protease HtpX [Candidatus Binatia bacterium]